MEDGRNYGAELLIVSFAAMHSNRGRGTFSIFCGITRSHERQQLQAAEGLR